METHVDMKIVGMFATATAAMWGLTVYLVKLFFNWMTKYLDKKESQFRKERKADRRLHKQMFEKIEEKIESRNVIKDKRMNLITEVCQEKLTRMEGKEDKINSNVLENQTILTKLDNKLLTK